MPNLRKLLYPFSVLYHTITGTRNILYDQNILQSRSYDLPVICVGNLNTGGTGKSPMIEYLLSILTEDYKTATLSRGYKRESKGFRLVELQDSAILTGDEPLQFKNKYPQSIVAVDANRREGIAKLLKYSPDVVLLDDAFQHRKVEAGFNILLTAYGDLYVNDLLLPGGNLRESASGAGRADVIVVTKCPEDLSETEMEKIEKQLKPLSHQKVFFTAISYSEKVFSEERSLEFGNIKTEDFMLVTGIANPEPLLKYIQEKGLDLKHLQFPDHHNFTEKELKKLQDLPRILTTEKDYMRLKGRISTDKLFYLPIQVNFLRNREDFNSKIFSFIKKNEV
ncbi:tetraacyldisaccharide 4'-kinase [Christiangramia sediminis]|uniref:Tetraacyldisaccharide 4'-kinase n=1 Tax=Christiangramia sediminis TaxID=2881336 RepID=A0A9X1LIN9_9FLAO|nr:tetraacyldisaccharide 4'-kinase [Christiangramia sediminis]MCB7481105.1 tetraacyldisaccharide 4'-kinase [Christiangramia sediminis]